MNSKPISKYANAGLSTAIFFQRVYVRGMACENFETKTYWGVSYYYFVRISLLHVPRSCGMNMSPKYTPTHQTANLWTLPCLYKALWNEGPWLGIPYIRLISWGFGRERECLKTFTSQEVLWMWCCKVRKTPNFVCWSTKNNSARLNSHAMCVFQQSWLHNAVVNITTV